MRSKGSKHVSLLISLPERTVNIISNTAQVFIASAGYCNTDTYLQRTRTFSCHKMEVADGIQ
jgi:hypothetical protein